MKKLENTVSIVTGGSNNIGREICRIFANEGSYVIFFDVDEESAQETSNIIKNDGNDVLFIKCDVTNIKEISESVKSVLSDFGKIDVLVNNVGGSKGDSFLDMNEEIFNYNMDINLKSAFFCTKEVLPNMISRNEGSIIFISTINVLFGGFNEIAYAASKAGLHSLIKTLTAEYARYNLRFNLLCPGSIIGDSKIWSIRFKKNPEIKNNLSKLYPLRRYGTPIDVANAALFFASKESEWISGVSLPIDGGLTATGNLPGGEWWNLI